MPQPHSLPEPYLDLRLRDVLALARALPRPGEPVEIDTLAAALTALARQEARRRAEIEASEREWLAQQFDALPTSLAEIEAADRHADTLTVRPRRA